MTMRLSTRSVAATLAATLLIALLPATVSAQIPLARVDAYEVWEALQFRGPIKKADAEAYRRRFAEAGLLGLKPLTPSSLGLGPGVNNAFSMADGIVVEATSNVNVDPRSRQFGTGPIRGEFQLLTFMSDQVVEGADPNLAQLVVTADGRLQGTLDLRLALDTVDPAPLAPVHGTWQLKKGGRPGWFSGTFLIPVSIPFGPPFGTVTFYVIPRELQQDANPFGLACAQQVHPALLAQVGMELGNGAIACRLEPEEFVLGFALTKAVIFLFE